jgi:hypothetical protein
MTQLVAAGSATTNPAPSTLSTVSPYTNSSSYRFTPLSAWTTQAKPAIISKGIGGKCRLDFKPSSAAATYTVTIWVLDRVTATWFTPDPNNSPSLNCTGSVETYLADMGTDPWFIQLSNISTGTVQILYDADVAQSL